MEKNGVLKFLDFINIMSNKKIFLYEKDYFRCDGCDSSARKL